MYFAPPPQDQNVVPLLHANDATLLKTKEPLAGHACNHAPRPICSFLFFVLMVPHHRMPVLLKWDSAQNKNFEETSHRGGNVTKCWKNGMLSRIQPALDEKTTQWQRVRNLTSTLRTTWSARREYYGGTCVRLILHRLRTVSFPSVKQRRNLNGPRTFGDIYIAATRQRRRVTQGSNIHRAEYQPDWKANAEICVLSSMSQVLPVRHAHGPFLWASFLFK